MTSKDEAGSQVPPSVGEFALQEHTRLLSDNADLRARLAKYEDAEGRPLQPAADLARRIDQAITAFTNGRAAMHVPPQDTDVDIVLAECLKLASYIESQAREIERLTSQLERWLSLDKQRDAALAALKAQPSGVVLPRDPEKSFLEWASNCPLPPTQLDAYRAGIAEVARLNSPPVSAGGVVLCGDSPRQAIMERHLAQLKESHPDCHVEGFLNDSEAVGAGGVDERAAFEAAYLAITGNKVGSFDPIEADYVSDLLQRQFSMFKAGVSWQARAALTASAPNHSEQVRVPGAFLEAAQQADDVLTAIIRNNEPIATLERTYGKDWHEAVGKIRTALILQIAAAPSAGSQGGDV